MALTLKDTMAGMAFLMSSLQPDWQVHQFQLMIIRAGQIVAIFHAYTWFGVYYDSAFEGHVTASDLYVCHGAYTFNAAEFSPYLPSPAYRLRISLGMLERCWMKSKHCTCRSVSMTWLRSLQSTKTEVEHVEKSLSSRSLTLSGLVWNRVFRL